jgi:cell wall-associated NlpC family hydrolase
MLPLVAQAQWFESKRKGEERRLRNEVVAQSREHVGKPYRWNQSGPNAFDCSGFVYYVLKTALGAKFPLSYSLSTMKGYRNQSVYYRDQLRQRGARIDCEQSQIGDVVFFHPLRRGENNHIGIITNPSHRYFITAQGKELGVAEHSYSERSYWGQRSPECYRNAWL